MQKTKAIILLRKNINEADKLIFLYSLNFGKLVLVARGLRKAKAKMASHLEIFNLSDIIIAGKTITNAQVINSFENLRINLEILEKAHYITSLINEFTAEADSDQNIFMLLKSTLEKLNSYENNIQNIMHSFEQQFISLLGIEPLNKNHNINIRDYIKHTLA
ncbi:DNA repair protein RecO [bacterium]|nr:DNA repair protein RecO [bacterium]|tara:strand:+ start:43173 stop:43658 length:486 start_codon:yes stop_codon:yes gene_type:complete